MPRMTLSRILQSPELLRRVGATPGVLLPTDNTQGIPTFDRDSFIEDRRYEDWMRGVQAAPVSPWLPVEPDMNQRQRAYSPETAQKYDLPFLWGPWDVQMTPKRSF